MKDVIVAMDKSSMEEIEMLLQELPSPSYIKIGMEAYYQFGESVLSTVAKYGHHIFLDLKLHDIPNTVYHGIKSLLRYPVQMINVHASGGLAMMEAAKKACDECANPPLLIAVTMLTSTSQETMNEELHIPGKVADTVVHYAMMAKKAGLDGVVCSAKEVPAIKSAIGSDFLTVTPGIRPLNADKHDQKRVVTPKEAREYGSDYIVVGRAITQAASPLAAYTQIKEEFLEEENV